MSVKTVFTAENELCYTMPLKVLNELIYKGIVRIVKTIHIEQAWVQEAKIPGSQITMKARIRRTEVAGQIGTPCTYDTKYYLTQNKRIELSAPLTGGEYALLKKLHKGAEVVNKSRLLLNDNHTLYTYEADIYEGRPNVRIEVEFENEADMKEFTPPDWLAQWRQG